MAEEYTQINRQAPFIEDRAEKLLATIFGGGDLKGLAETPTEVPAYEVAGLGPLQMQAMEQAQAGLGAYQPYLQAAGETIGAGLGSLQAATQTLDPSQVATYMDPYQQQVTQQALAELERQGQIASQQAAADAIQAGAFGGGREGVQRAELARNLQQVKSQRIFEDLSRNYLQAQQAQQATAQRLGSIGAQTLQAAQAQAGLGELGSQLGGQDINRLLGLGSLQQQFGYQMPGEEFTPGQAQIEAARQTTLAAQKEPFERAAFASDILRGVPSSQITYSQVPSPSTLQQVAGLGIAGLGALGGIGGGSISGGISSLQNFFR